MSSDSSPKKNKNILNSSFTYRILSKLSNGYRPSQIAEQLGVTPQDIYYHTNRMIDAGLLYKDTNKGIRWKLTEKGLFVLKQKYTGSLNHLKDYQTKPVSRLIPTRLDNLSFEFKIRNPIPSDPILKWTELKNGVSKCSFKYDSHTVELIKSEKGYAVLIHLDKKYCFDWTCELINQYNLALHYAKQAAIKFNLQITDFGKAVKRPHIAFEEDLIAQFVATSHTADINTNGKGDYNGGDDDKAWIDSSTGFGEFETNDPDYAYLYLTMPKTVEQIRDIVNRISRCTDTEYVGCYHPFLTRNN